MVQCTSSDIRGDRPSSFEACPTLQLGGGYLGRLTRPSLQEPIRIGKQDTIEMILLLQVEPCHIPSTFKDEAAV